MLCEQRLKEQGVLGSFINIDEYILDLIPYDGDLLSMEYESAFRVCSGSTVQICITCFGGISHIHINYSPLSHSGVLPGK